MKITFIIAIVTLFALCFFVFKKDQKSKILKNQATTKGTVEKVFFRGKLPFCEFSYIVNGKTHVKKQEITKANSKKIKNNSYNVLYEKNNPKNAWITFE